MELWNLAERICQAGELCFLHRSAVSRSDGINDRERCGVTPAAGGCGAAAAGPSRPNDLPLLHISQPRQIKAGRVPNRQSLRVDVDHDDHYQDPRKKNEKARVDGFHCARRTSAAAYCEEITASHKQSSSFRGDYSITACYYFLNFI